MGGGGGGRGRANPKGTPHTPYPQGGYLVEVAGQIYKIKYPLPKRAIILKL